MTTLIRFDGISKRFGQVAAVDDVTLEIETGEFFALLGPSGCGKTTLLRLLAGFEAPDAGRVLLDGQDITAVPPSRRPLNMVFQSYAVFPHMSVADNVAYGLRVVGTPRAEIAARVEEALALVQLGPLAQRKPAQLSGGQRQRVALARALVKRPRVLLLDEPLSALDKKLREEMQHELKRLQAEVGITFVMVTHDQDEAMSVASRVAVMSAGRIAQLGTPRDLYERPASRFVAGFFGTINMLSDGTALRPERVRIGAAPAGIATHPGTVLDALFFGDHSVAQLRLADGRTLRAVVPHADALPAAGQPVAAWWRPEDVIALKE